MASEAICEIFGIGPTIFPAKKHVLSIDLMISATLVDLFNKVIDSLWRIQYTKGFSENIPIAVAEHHSVLFLGIVYGYHQDFLAVARFLVDAKKLLTLLLKNGSFFHVGLLSIVAARSHDLHGNPRWLFNVPRASCPMAFVDIVGAPHVICKAPRVTEGNASRASLKAHSHPLHETLGWYQPLFSDAADGLLPQEILVSLSVTDH